MSEREHSVDLIATRGERLALTANTRSTREPQAFRAEVLGVIEIDADQRIAAGVVVDLDDIDAAFAELDARYLAGEAAAHGHTWSVFARLRRAQPARNTRTTPGLVNIDHRRRNNDAPGDLNATSAPRWTSQPDIRVHVAAVHRLSDLGAVLTQAANGTSKDGFDAEWREIAIVTVEGDLVNRCELFDEADLEAALARFDELSRSVPQLENDASRADDASRITSRPATGTRWRRYWPTTSSSTIAVGS